MENKKKTGKTLYLTLLSIVTILAVLFGLFVHVFRGYFYEGEKSESIVVKESFSNVDIDLDLTDFRIEYGDHYGVAYEYPRDMEPKVYVKGDTLYVEQQGNYKLHGIRRKTFKLTLILPAGVSLNNVDIDVDMGNIEFGKLDCKNLYVEADMGNIELDKIHCESFTAKADMGNIEVDGDFDRVTAKCSMGNIEVTSPRSIDEIELDLDVDMGQKTFNGKTL